MLTHGKPFAVQFHAIPRLRKSDVSGTREWRNW